MKTVGKTEAVIDHKDDKKVVGAAAKGGLHLASTQNTSSLSNFKATDVLLTPKLKASAAENFDDKKVSLSASNITAAGHAKIMGGFGLGH